LESIEIRILEKVKKVKRGTLFFTESFSLYGNADALRKALERLVKASELERLAAGIYYRPVLSDTFGKLKPTLEEVALAIAERDRARIVPTGDFALNSLGLSTQVPVNLIYLTDGSSRKITIGKHSVVFKKTTPKNVATIGKISGLAIQALKTIGKDKVRDKEITHIRELLKKEKTERLKHDIQLAPAWIREIMLPVLKQSTDQQQ